MRRPMFFSLLAVAAALTSAASASAAAPSPPHIQLAPLASFTAPAPGSGPSCAATNPDGSQTTVPCFFPAVLKQAYDFPTGSSAPTGAGQTIVIVDAYGSKTIKDDLTAFDARFDLPAPPSFKVFSVPGTCDGPPDCSGTDGLFGWGLETSLDVEYAHAIAPGAKIVLVVAGSDSVDDLVAAEAAVLPRYPGAIVSQSFGDFETDDTAGGAFATQHQVLLSAALAGGTLIASSGDAGATWTSFTGTTSPAIASYPASDPLVLAVGGTMGDPYPVGLWKKGRYGGEQVWNEPDLDAAAGGAPSVLFDAPAWQSAVTGSSARAVPDVSYYAGIQAGVVVVYSPHAWLVGGTSAGSPQWAGIVALANELRGRAGLHNLGLAAPALYALAGDSTTYGNDFHDVKKGTNALDSSVGFDAGRGYDLASGLGTPDVANLLRDLAHVPSTTVADDPAPYAATHGGRGRHTMTPGG